MKRIYLLLIPAALIISGCAEVREESVRESRRVEDHIAKFRHYDPPWVDHAQWLKTDNSAKSGAK